MAEREYNRIYQIKVSLRGLRPTIWRRILVPSTMTLAQLHDTIQIAMGWSDAHLHQFVVNDDYFGIPDSEFPDDTKNENFYKLYQILRKEKDYLLYEYDICDSWEHKVVLEKVFPLQKDIPLPQCIKGQRACPPEDCGGIWGYQDFLYAILEPCHPEHKDMLEWIGGSFDAEFFDIEQTNRMLMRFCKLPGTLANGLMI